jgi:hypothetical protein
MQLLPVSCLSTPVAILGSAVLLLNNPPIIHRDHFSTMAANKKYKSILIQFMSYCDQIDYDKEHEFTQVELSAITPTVGGMKSKGWAQDHCCEYFKELPFDNEKGPLSTHSLHKYGSTYCCNNGVSQEDTNTCGCWKTKSQAAAVSDHYDDTELPFVDTCVAAGPCSYVAEPRITNTFYFTAHYTSCCAMLQQHCHAHVWLRDYMGGIFSLFC